MVGNVSLGGVTCGRVDYVDHPERPSSPFLFNHLFLQHFTGYIFFSLQFGLQTFVY